MKSGRIKFFKAENGEHNEEEWPDAELDGEVLNIARDKRYQQFILILVKQRVKDVESPDPKISNHNSEYQHVLWIYTERHYETKLNIPSQILSDDVELFVIPAAKLGESAFLMIDSACSKTSIFYEISIPDNKEIPPEAFEMPNICFERPFNVTFGTDGFTQNKLVGFMEQPIEGDDENNMSIFVSRRDITLEKVVEDPNKTSEFTGPKIMYKHFNDRNI